MFIKGISATVIFSVCLLQSCVTAPTKEYGESKVIERIGGKTETPEWASGAIAMTEEGANVIFVSQMSMAGNARSEACVKAAEMDGKSAMLKYIKEHISTSGQLNEADASSDPGYESLTAFLAQSKLSGVKTIERYYEKREESSESGERVLKLRCLAKLAIKKSELEKQLREATTKQGGNPEIREKLLEAQKSFIEGLSDEKSGSTSEE